MNLAKLDNYPEILINQGEYEGKTKWVPAPKVTIVCEGSAEDHVQFMVNHIHYTKGGTHLGIADDWDTLVEVEISEDFHLYVYKYVTEI